MPQKKKVLFLGETYRADAITWMNGIREFGDFEIYTWELAEAGVGIKKLKRVFELIFRLGELKRKIVRLKPDLIIAERVTSYGFLAALFHKYAPVVIAQQGITDIYPPNSLSVPFKKVLQNYAFKHATLIHAWGEIMTYSMLKSNTGPQKIMVLSKGIDLVKFSFAPDTRDEKIRAIVTRSLTEDYRHETVLKCFEIIKKQNIPFELTIIGDGTLLTRLKQSAIDKNIKDEVVFTGRIPNTELPKYIANSDLYISMPCTEGVSASLFEAMSGGCYPIISDLPGNRAWITDKINGRLIEVDNVVQLAEAVSWYADHRKDLKDVLYKNRETVEQKASYSKNMAFITGRYLEIINRTGSK